MKTAPVFVWLLLLAGASAQQNDMSRPNGVIHGIAIGQDGQPATRIGLTAQPLGVGLGAKLPQVRTNDAGEYRFENLPWWGRYTVYVDDEEAATHREIWRDGFFLRHQCNPHRRDASARLPIRQMDLNETMGYSDFSTGSEGES